MPEQRCHDPKSQITDVRIAYQSPKQQLGARITKAGLIWSDFDNKHI